jgi:hypothetical protein
VELFDFGIAEDGSLYYACGVPKIALDAAAVCDRSRRAPIERIHWSSLSRLHLQG